MALWKRDRIEPVPQPPVAPVQPAPQIQQPQPVNQERYEIGKVGTQFEIVIIDNKTGEQLTIPETLSLILNKLEKYDGYIIGR